MIGTDDMLSIVFWRDKDMTAEVVVRPDGKITLPLVNDIQAAGLTPEQLRDRVTSEAAKYRRPQPHGRRQTDQQPQRVHHRSGREAWRLSADRANDGAAADLIRRRPARVREQQGHRHHATGVTNQLSLRFNYRDVLKGKNLNRTSSCTPATPCWCRDSEFTCARA